MNSKIALAMIVKGEDGEHLILKRALQSIAPYVDGIFITITGEPNKVADTEKVCREFKANISYTRALWTAKDEDVKWLTDFFGYAPHMKVDTKVFQFDEARNYNFSQVPKEYKYILWMDTDDIFQNGARLRQVADIADQANIEATYMNYVYQADINEAQQCVSCNQPVEAQYQIKHVVIEHLRERLVVNTGVYKWISNIHETLIEQIPTRKTDNYDCSILHLATHEDRLKSLTRNLPALELAILRSQGKDPRHIYYLAKAFFDINTPETDDKLIPLINQYLYGENKSGWPEERAQANEYLADIYKRKNQFNNSIKAAMNALIESPENPAIYINLASTYMLKQDWDKAMFWVKLASTVPEKKTTLVKNPLDIQVRTLQVIYNCCLNQGKVKEAWAAAAKMFELLPDDPNVAQTAQFADNLRREWEAATDTLKMVNYLKQTGERHKIKSLLASIPHYVENNPDIADLIVKNNPPTPWNKDEIAIYCGPGFTTWSPKRMEDPQGSFVGGSEEAVIKMSEALVGEGWKVTVYGDPGSDEGEINGVKWLPYYKFNKRDNFNILVVWRQIGFFDQELSAKKTYLWNHDIQFPLEYKEERIQKITKCIFLSQWHRDNVPDLPEDKVMLSSNGI